MKGWAYRMISVGGNNYIIHKHEQSKEDYLQCLSSLENNGYVKYADNGDGFGGTVFSSTYIKDELAVHVVYFSCEKHMSISFCEGPISEHLIYQDSYVADKHAGAKTTMHMLELFRLGNSFLFQLKNGHFIISDGGLAADLPYLLDYLESLVPEGERPIIEAWFITHAHGDHSGALCQFSKHTEWMERVCVEGVYYSSPNEEKVLGICGCEILDYEIRWVTRRLRNVSGEPTKLYRPQTGQRYYFNDITIDILLAQEQVPFGYFRKDLNTSSTVCLFTIEGQKCFFSGDIQEEGLDFVIRNYPKEYLEVDFFTLNHHGMNLSMEFADYATAKTMLLTVRDVVPIRKLRETKQMCEKAEESVVWGDGTKVFTFPYETGTFETLPQKEWIYNENEERAPQPNLYTCPGKCLQGWIFDADKVLFDGDVLRKGAKEFFRYLVERKVMMSAFSTETTDVLIQKMKNAGIYDCFKLLMGADSLDEEKPYLDAAQKSEKAFELDHIYKYVVVCDSIAVVEEVIKDGFKTLVVTRGEEISEELKLKCWHTFESLDTIYDFIELKKVYFE